MKGTGAFGAGVRARWAPLGVRGVRREIEDFSSPQRHGGHGGAQRLIYHCVRLDCRESPLACSRPNAYEGRRRLRRRGNPVHLVHRKVPRIERRRNEGGTSQ